MKKMNNKGFSLVELIVVIAIMAVLVGVLAPQFIKYVENSRRSSDVSSADSIRSAILADMADNVSPFKSAKSKQSINSSYLPSAISSVPKMSATSYKSKTFVATWDPAKGTCEVYTSDNSYCLTDPDQASYYKNQLTNSGKKPTSK